MRKNGTCYIEISANTNTLKSEMILKDNYDVDFRQYNSINSLLGFYSKFYTSGYHESENMVNILTINSILVNIDIISASYVNGSTQPTIYEYDPITDTNLNSDGDIRISTESQDMFTHPSESYLIFEGRLTKADNTAYANADNARTM